MFQPGTYDPRRIDTELGWARLHGLNTVRVFLHDQLWAQDSRGFQTRLAQFVNITSRHRIKPLFVLFDSCWDPHPQVGRQHAPTPGVHNSGWVQGPGADRIDDKSYTRTLQDYVTGVMTQFRNDDRVLGWDVWNEPDNPAPQYASVERGDKLDRVADLLPQVFTWARAVDVRQPLTSGVWDGEWADASSRTTIQNIQLANSDVISFHSYAGPSTFESRIGELTPHGRPDPVHRVHGPAPGQYRRIDPANCQAAQRRRDQLGFGGRQDADLLPVGLVEASVFSGPESVVPRSAAARWNCVREHRISDDQIPERVNGRLGRDRRQVDPAVRAGGAVGDRRRMAGVAERPRAPRLDVGRSWRDRFGCLRFRCDFSARFTVRPGAGRLRWRVRRRFVGVGHGAGRISARPVGYHRCGGLSGRRRRDHVRPARPLISPCARRRPSRVAHGLRNCGEQCCRG